ncbi:MAG: DUF192 domain-containing protein [Actinomycetes bacterium]|jgi:hypothetical protein|nr:DUF192 domain-containing protein [Actinomycetes bacterium]
MNIHVTQHYFERLRGLLGTNPEQLPFEALCINPCKGVHTIGMRYEIDLAWLDRRWRVLKTQRRVCPGRICPAPAGTCRVLERPARHGFWLQRGEYVAVDEQ